MRTYPDRPWVAIGVVVHHDNQILLIKRGKEPNKGRWSLPGGAQDLGETVFEGAYREVLEETDIKTLDHKFIDCVDSIYKDDEGRIEYHYTLLEVSCLYDSGEAIALDDAEAVIWADADYLAPYDLRDDTLRIISQSLNVRGMLR